MLFFIFRAILSVFISTSSVVLAGSIFFMMMFWASTFTSASASTSMLSAMSTTHLYNLYIYNYKAKLFIRYLNKNTYEFQN